MSVALYGHDMFPVAVAEPTGAALEDFIEPTMFYVFLFSNHADDFVPVAVFQLKAEAEAVLRMQKDVYQERYGDRASGAVLQLTWSDFKAMARGGQSPKGAVVST